MALLNILFSVLLLTLSSCKPPQPTSPATDPAWIKLDLPDAWELSVPQDFSATREKGIDSQPGTLFSIQDSIYLAYDIGREMSLPDECSFESSLASAKAKIQNGFYQEYYQVPLVHSASIDTVDDKVAVIIRPVKSGKGVVEISITDCQTGKWISISGKNLSIENEDLVLKIFKTLRSTRQQ